MLTWNETGGDLRLGWGWGCSTCFTWSENRTDQLRLHLLCNGEVGSLLPQIMQQTSICHIWHYNIWGRACIHTHSNQVENVRVGKWLHLQALVQQLSDIPHARHHWIDNVNVEHNNNPAYFITMVMNKPSSMLLTCSMSPLPSPYPHASSPPSSLKYFTGRYLQEISPHTFQGFHSNNSRWLIFPPTQVGTVHHTKFSCTNITSVLKPDVHTDNNKPNHTTIITNASGYESCNRQTCITVSDDWRLVE